MGDASHFLKAITEREQRWIDALFDQPLTDCRDALQAELSLA